MPFNAFRKIMGQSGEKKPPTPNGTTPPAPASHPPHAGNATPQAHNASHGARHHRKFQPKNRPPQNRNTHGRKPSPTDLHNPTIGEPLKGPKMRIIPLGGLDEVGKTSWWLNTKTTLWSLTPACPLPDPTCLVWITSFRTFPIWNSEK
ncbi:hypothetical protein IPJ72_00060 [Candidatus Peregrinibacteria bacterium]|nr:MAG: hypothetical protein IPJ72_00060 [Candidatus Peregrinibacteria bacterium]